jgi:hypothetical protein
MKSVRNLIFGAALFVAALLGSAPIASAAQIVMCAPDAVATATGARRVLNPNTNVAYALNSAGCAPIAIADIGYFSSQGFTTGPNLGSFVFQTGTATATQDFIVGTLPPGTYIQQIIAQNVTATAVTGGIAFGTTANATDIASTLTCGANCLTSVANASIGKQLFSTTASQAIHAAAATAWANANVIITVIWGYF